MCMEENVTYSLTREEREWEMDAKAKIALLKRRLQILDARGKDNQGVCRRVERDIRNLEKKLRQ